MRKLKIGWPKPIFTCILFRKKKDRPHYSRSESIKQAMERRLSLKGDEFGDMNLVDDK